MTPTILLGHTYDIEGVGAAVIDEIRSINGEARIKALPLGAGDVPADERAELTYGQKLIAEAIDAHFGERIDDYDEDVDDTTNHDVWKAFDALTSPPSPVGADDGSMTAEEIRLENLKQMAAYAGPIVSFEVREPFYLASCDRCGWVGSSERCGTDSHGDDSDVYCPRCHASGADCGKVVTALASAPQPAKDGWRETLEEIKDIVDSARGRRLPIVGQIAALVETALSPTEQAAPAVGVEG